MRKFQVFLLVEALLLTAGLLVILSNNVSNFILLVVVMLLAIRLYTLEQRGSFLLTLALLVLFLILMLNPYIVLAVLLAVAYMVINHFAQVKRTNRYALLEYSRTGLKARPIQNQWIGSKEYTGTDTYAFDDVNVLRLSGSDVIDLSRVLISGQENVILIRKLYGPTRIIVPRDVSVFLDVSCLYGTLQYFEAPSYDLRNATLKLGPDEENPANRRRVKVVMSIVAGYIEVSRP